MMVNDFEVKNGKRSFFFHSVWKTNWTVGACFASSFLPFTILSLIRRRFKVHQNNATENEVTWMKCLSFAQMNPKNSIVLLDSYPPICVSPAAPLMGCHRNLSLTTNISIWIILWEQLRCSIITEKKRSPATARCSFQLFFGCTQTMVSERTNERTMVVIMDIVLHQRTSLPASF